MPNHQPVLLEEVLRCLQPKKDESYLDVTAGYGGHAQAILARTSQPSRALLIDRDADAVAALKKRFKSKGVQVVHEDFLSASKALASQNHRFDMILADLGVSSTHIDNSSRGFSLKNPGPLDMRMDVRQVLTAERIVNSASEAELARIFKDYGEEPKAHQIANRILRVRPIKNTKELAAIVATAWPGKSRRHPATRVFQALRIAVNDELSLLEQSLPVWLELLSDGGRLAVISFHSLEDRLVKRFIAEHSGAGYAAELKSLTKKPIAATNSEIVSNPRARSAKLRAAEKIKTKRKDQKARNAY